MDSWLLAMMLGASILLGGVALSAFLWALKSGQFDDEEKFLNAVKFDGEEDLNDAAKQDEKRKKLKKGYRPE
jgi:cbb3-type cytochrome oxidase maturation protein